MRQVDVAHQPEDQREARRDEEIERAERDAAEQRVEEDLLAAQHILEAVGHGAKISHRSTATRIAMIRVQTGWRLTNSCTPGIPAPDGALPVDETVIADPTV